jgi:hypothetical protein
MPIIPSPVASVDSANEATPFDVTLAVADTEEELVAVPGGKLGRVVSLSNEGPGSAFIEFDAAATLTSLEIKKNESYGEMGLEISTDVRLIGETGKQPRVRGILWSGI